MSLAGMFVNTKYNILQQQANTAAMEARARAQQMDAQTGEIPANDAAHRAALYGQADSAFGQGAASRGQAKVFEANAATAPRLADASIHASGAQAYLHTTQADTQRAIQGALLPDSVLSVLSKRLGGSGTASNPSAVPPNPNFINVGGTPAAGGTPPVGTPPASGAPIDDDAALWHPYNWSGGSAAGDSNIGGHPMRVPGHASGVTSVGNNIVGAETGARSQGNNIAGTDPGVRGQPGHALDLSQVPNRDNAPVLDMTHLPSFTAGFAAGCNLIHGHAAGSDQIEPQGTAEPFQGGGMPAAQNYKKGTDKVAGKGDGTKDKTLSMLAPGEAVLNKAAADHLGRDTIDRLNQLGAKDMGLKQKPNEPADVPVSNAEVPGNAAGNSNPFAKGKPPAKGAAPAKKGADDAPPKKGDAPAKKGGKAPGKGISPEAIHALLGVLGGAGGAGGMPPPGGMPGPMGPPPSGAMPPQAMPGRGLQ